MPPAPRSPTPSPEPRVAVVGAGAIGCWVGGMLAPTTAVTLIGRPGVLDPVRADGLTVEAPGLPSRLVPADRPTLTTDPAAVSGAEVVLVSVKSRDTLSAAAAIAGHLQPGTVVVSLQNGLHNADRLREALPGNGVHVVAGMVEFNVVRTGPATYRRATSGDIYLGQDPALDGFLAAAETAGLRIHARADIREVQHAKLLLNLNNAVNALSGLPLREELGQRDYRRVLAACQEEALAVYAAIGVTPARLTPISPAATIRMLRSPDPVFRAAARASLRVDPTARSSMADDLAAGRPTEIAELQGEVARLGQAHGIPTPVCEAVCRLVAEAERAGPDTRRRWDGRDLLHEVLGGRRG